MGQRGVVSDPYCKSVGPLTSPLPAQVLVLLLTGPQNDNSNVHGHQAVDGFGKNVQPLLVDQPRDHADHRRIAGDLKAHGFRQFIPARLLARHIPLTAGLRDEGIVCGTPDRVIDPKRNPDQPIPQPRQHAVQSAPELLGSYFLRIRLADRRYNVRGSHPAFNAVDVAEELEVIHVETEERQIGQGVQGPGIDSLVREIVHRENRLLCQVAPHAIDPVAKKERHQSGLPVAAVHNIRPLTQGVDQGDHGFLEEHEPLEIVVVVAFRQTVELAAIEELIPADEVGLRCGFQSRPDLGPVHVEPNGNIQANARVFEVVICLRDPPVERHDTPHLHAVLQEGPRQG